MDAASETDALRCSSCSRQFNRPDHLRRHAQSHTDVRPFACQFCPLTFGRRDALIRHWKTCKQRAESGSTALPKLQCEKRGRKRIACDQCAKSKRKCSRKIPCDVCVQLGENCTVTTDSPEPLTISSSSNRDVNSPISWQSASPVGISEALSDLSASPALSYKAPNKSDDSTSAGSSDRHKRRAPQGWNLVKTTGSALTIPKTLSPVYNPLMVPHSRLRFLSKFTSSTGFATSFECGNLNERHQIMLTLAGGLQHQMAKDNLKNSQLISAITYDDDALVSASSPHLVDTFSWQLFANLTQNIPVPDRSKDMSWHPLAVKCQEIVVGIRETIQQHPPEGGFYSMGWTLSEQQQCSEFFSPFRLERYMIAFWAMWYPNWPAFHRPTFVASEKPARLVASMALIGASLTSDESDNDQARYWGAAVEEWVFSAPELCEEPEAPLASDAHFANYKVETRLHALRAAYAMILYMNWEGTSEQQQAVRRYRFGHVISVTRSILRQFPMNQGGSLRELYLCGNNAIEGWKAFVLREELIRTVLYVFMLDCAYSLFNNSAPRLVVQEMRFPLVCPEICFQVSNVDIWRLHMEAWANSQTGRAQPLMSDVIMLVFEPNLLPQQWALLHEMSPLNFFAIANAFHGLLFYHRHGIPSTPSVECFINGLHNWKQAWGHRQAVLGHHEMYRVGPSNAWRRIGFMRYGIEYWRLALIIFRQSELARGGEVAGNPYVYTEFDETNMNQVHELITKFQDVNLGEYDL